jgi:hypothetical protein
MRSGTASSAALVDSSFPLGLPGRVVLVYPAAGLASNLRCGRLPLPSGWSLAAS